MAENTSHVAACEISAASKGHLTLFHAGSDLVLRQVHMAKCFARAWSTEPWWEQYQEREDQRGKSRPGRRSSWGQLRIPTAWGCPGVGTPCRCSDCPLSHSQCVLWHHQHTWRSWTCCGGIWPSTVPEPGSAAAQGQLRSWMCLELKASLERQGQLQGKRYLRIGHWTEEEKKGGRRQRYQLGGTSVDRNATWRCTYSEIKTDMLGEGRNLEKGV